MKREAMLFLVAVQFLTRLPVPALAGFELSWLSQSARYFPLVGTLVGLTNVAVWWLSSLIFPPAVAIGLMMCASLLVTGAFHEDGFADACDGFGGGRSPTAVLAIMKDSRVGAYGAMGIAMMLGLKWTVFTHLSPAIFAVVVVAAHTSSRWCATALIWQLAYVRADQDAKSKPLADNLNGKNWALSGALGAVAILCLILVISPESIRRSSLLLLAALGVSLVSTFLAGAYFKGRIGGYTGDCLGATQQLAELCFLLTALGMSALSLPEG
jgi:adenosylcobinamide-GDP ribazoletransferase